MRLRNLAEIDDNQYGFCSGKSTTGAVFKVRQLQERFATNNTKLHYIFVDLEKVFNREPKLVIAWAKVKEGDIVGVGVRG